MFWVKISKGGAASPASTVSGNAPELGYDGSPILVPTFPPLIGQLEMRRCRGSTTSYQLLINSWINGHAQDHNFSNGRDAAAVTDIGTVGCAGDQYIGTRKGLETTVTARSGRPERIQLRLRCGCRARPPPSRLAYGEANANGRTIGAAGAMVMIIPAPAIAGRGCRAASPDGPRTPAFSPAPRNA